METIVNSVGQGLNPLRNKALTDDKSPETSKKASTEESRSPDLGAVNEPRDRVEIRNLRQSLIESNRNSLENSIKDVDEAGKLLEEVKRELNSENEISRIEKVHGINQKNLVELLS